MAPELSFPQHNLFYLDEQPEASKSILLLHGLGANSSSWVLQIPELVKAGYRVVAPDTRGFGKSGFPGRTSVQLMVTDIIKLMNALQIARSDVVWISMGGTQALQMALDYPERINRLVLVNTFASLRPKSLKVWAYFFYRLLLVHTVGLETQAKFVAQRLFPKPEQETLRQELIAQVRQASPAGYRSTMRTLGLYDVTYRLGDIRSPTLIVTGDQDTTVPPHVQKVLLTKIPNASHAIIPGAGHAVTVEQPVAFNRLLLAFLSDRI